MPSRRSPLFQAALEAIEGAAMVIDAKGRVLEANAAARDVLTDGGAPLRDDLARVVRAGEADLRWKVTTVPSEDALEFFVTARAAPAERLGSHLASVGTEWNLTPRQREVLARVVEGRANKAIASSLDICDRTVEVHVTALLAKAGVDNRATLIARVLSAR